MTDLKDLYQEVIIDHSRRPRNFFRMDDANRTAQGHNPLCGDKVTLYLKYEDGILRKISFEGSGCAISTASASMLADCLEGKPRAEVDALIAEFHGMVTGQAATGQAATGQAATGQAATGQAARAPDLEKLGKLAAFAGVSEFPARVKCATLAWHTLAAALAESGERVSTEDGS